MPWSGRMLQTYTCQRCGSGQAGYEWEHRFTYAGDIRKTGECYTLNLYSFVGGIE